MKKNNPTIILGSASVARRELLESVFLPVVVLPSYLKEVLTDTIEPQAQVRQIATKKAAAVRKRISKNDWILAADTVILHGDRLFGKPNNRDTAKTLLKSLAGHVHRVLTGVALITPNGNTTTATATTNVSVESMTNHELKWYLDTGEWKDAAGGYKIQGRAGFFINQIEGSYSNVVGLPLETIYRMLSCNGYPFFGGVNWP